jgi:UDP-N-acetylglucosamine diphosphorylase / glucose-1-phosphate thymidylyltransferase / UDP-N-acetylgalactosamine diphosphorylase / glucosamine-1-phosphate N-acetyltransferase / galactosamine-1-phosphate N-acetyltransferase
MKAVILAAGKGTRMKNLTNELPKPMLRVQGKPILEHIITGLIAAGVREFFIVTGWRAEVIEDYFGDGSKWNARIAYGRQVVQDGTGKAPELAKDFVGSSPFILTYGDILVKAETYQQMVARFGERFPPTNSSRVQPTNQTRLLSRPAATLSSIPNGGEGRGEEVLRFMGSEFGGVVTVTGSEDVTKGGLFFFDDQFCLKHLVEKPSSAQLEELRTQGLLKHGSIAWYNAGIYIFKPSIFDFTARLQKSPRGEYELTDAISAFIAAGQTLAGLQIQGRWVDVRDPEVLASLQS